MFSVESIRRVFIFLEDGDFKSADEYCEKVLDIEPENAHAYLGKLMAELQIKQQDNLKDLPKPFNDNSNYQKIMKFGNDNIKSEIKSYIDCINKRNYLEQCEKKYQEALAIYENEFSDRNKLTRAKEIFENISDYKDSKELIEQYDEKVREHEHNINERDRLAKLESIYQTAYSFYKTSNANQVEKAKEIFERLSSYKDSNEMVSKCNEKIRELQNSEKYKQANNLVSESKSHYDTFIKENIIEAISKLDEAEEIFVSLGNYQSSKSKVETCRKRKQEYQAKIKEIGETKKRRKKIAVVGSVTAVIVVVAIIVVNTVIIPSIKYNNAVAMMENGQYNEAIIAFTELGGYKDSKQQHDEIWMNLQKTNNKQNNISSGGSYTVGLKENGTVVATGKNDDGRCNVSGWEDIIAVSAGSYHTVGLKKDGTVVATGHNGHGQCNVSDWKDIIAVSAGSYHTVGLKVDGTVVATGHNGYEQCNVSGWEDIIAVSAGSYHTVGLKKDGTVVAVGSNVYGQRDVSGWKDIIAVSAGSYHTVGLKKDGTVVATGYNDYGKCDVSDWKDIIAVSAGGDYTVGLKKDGTVVATGNNVDGQCNVSGWKDIIAISAGGSHTVGLKADGTVVATGSDMYGQCDVSDWKLKVD